jgi:hypothetical protein
VLIEGESPGSYAELSTDLLTLELLASVITASTQGQHPGAADLPQTEKLG